MLKVQRAYLLSYCTFVCCRLLPVSNDYFESEIESEFCCPCDYETIGGLFGKIYMGMKELTVVECIWKTIVQVVATVAEIFTLDAEEVLKC